MSRRRLWPKVLSIYDSVVDLTLDFAPLRVHVRDDDANDTNECSSTEMLSAALREKGASRARSRSVIAIFTSAPNANDAVKQRVVITGSTRGLGLELAKSFLSQGDSVFVTSRDAGKVAETVAALRTAYGDDVVAGLEGGGRWAEGG